MKEIGIGIAILIYVCSVLLSRFPVIPILFLWGSVKTYYPFRRVICFIIFVVTSIFCLFHNAIGMGVILVCVGIYLVTRKGKECEWYNNRYRVLGVILVIISIIAIILGILVLILS